MSNNNYDALAERYRAKPAGDPPSPWRRVPGYIAGVTAVGFGEGSELLLVLSHSGLGVVDCTTGTIIEHLTDVEAYVEDEQPLSAKGIGPLQGQRVPLAGLWGEDFGVQLEMGGSYIELRHGGHTKARSYVLPKPPTWMTIQTSRPS